ncbi:hypothetical protein C8Q76DRAFT_201493 [Earliella scabrosa]|nr:hypothetical protein C8Q76DRAFT_201493 [Earliella scabrosa]
MSGTIVSGYTMIHQQVTRCLRRSNVLIPVSCLTSCSCGRSSHVLYMLQGRSARTAIENILFHAWVRRHRARKALECMAVVFCASSGRTVSRAGPASISPSGFKLSCICRACIQHNGSAFERNHRPPMPRTASARAQPLSGAEPEPRTTGCNSAADVLSRDAVSGGFAKRGPAEARTRRCAFYLPTPMSVLDSAGVTSSIAHPRPSAFFWSRTRAVRGRSCLTRARSRSRGALRRGDGVRLPVCRVSVRCSSGLWVGITLQ